MSGCKEDKWGDIFKTFVEAEVPVLAKNFAETQLNKKWGQALNDQSIFSAEQLRLLAGLTRDLQLPTIPDQLETETEEALVQLYVRLLNAGIAIGDLELQTVTAQKQLERTSAICTDRNAFDLLDLNNEMVRGLFAIAAPEKNETWYASTNLFETAVFWVFEIFARSEQEKQQEAFGEGMAKLAKVLPRDDLLFETSSNICAARYDAVKSQLTILNQGYDSLRRFVGVRRSEQIASQHLVEFYVLRIGVKRLEREFGLDNLYLKAVRLKWTEAVEAALVQSFIDYLQLISAIRNATDPVVVLVLSEKAEAFRQAILKDIKVIELEQLSLSTEALIAQQRAFLDPDEGVGE